MFELWVQFTTYVAENYKVAITAIIATATTVGLIVAGLMNAKRIVMTIVQPILDWIKNKDEQDETKELATNKLENIKVNIMKTDLIAKLSNPTLGEDVKASYQRELEKLVALNPLNEEDKNTIADAVEEAKKYL